MEKSYSGKIFGNLLRIFLFLGILFYGMPIVHYENFRTITVSVVVLFGVYVSLDDMFSKVVITNHGIVEKHSFPFQRETLIPYSSITHIYSRLAFRGFWWNHIIDSTKGSITISNYSKWRECLRELSQRVDIKLIDLDVQKSIGIR